MIKSSTLRVVPGAKGVSIWSAEIFGGGEALRLRDFLTRAFSVREVQGVELRRAASFGYIGYGAVADPAPIWKQLGRALRDSEHSLQKAESSADRRTHSVDAGLVYLDPAGTSRIRVSRVGDSLTTWRVVDQSERTLRLWHPILRNRRDVVFRLEEELGTILGVQDFRASALTGGLSIRFDNRALTASSLAKQLEKAWPRLVDGLDGPPSRKRFVAAVGLFGLAVTGQYLAPAVRPIALAGMALYSSHNVVSAAKQLTRGEVGLSALYSTGLTFMLIGGSPFGAALFATLMQFWPDLGRRKLVSSQRRLFAGQRRRPIWARLVRPDGSEVEANVDDLRRNDFVVVRRGDTIAVDGVVESGYAAVVQQPAIGWDQVNHLFEGDLVSAGAYVGDGQLTIRVEHAGEQTAASYVGSLLPHTTIPALPSLQEAERIANRNAKPALALSLLSLLLTRTLRVSQAVIRPDYVTAPRLSAQLSALHAIATGLPLGVLFRNPAALDRLARIDTYVIDDSAGLARRSLEVAQIQTVKGVSAEAVAGYALAASPSSHSERARALSAFAAERKSPPTRAGAVEHLAGVSRYRDEHGSAIEVATAPYLAANKVDIPQQLRTVPVRRANANGRGTGIETTAGAKESSRRPLWVLRDGAVIGIVSFAQSGEFVGKQLVAALRATNKAARILYLVRAGDEKAGALAGELGIELCEPSVGPSGKVDLVRGVSGNTLWIGDGSDANAREVMAASAVSVSVAPLSRVREDAADILLPLKGIAGLPALIELGAAHARRLKQDFQAVYTANLVGVAGAVLSRVTSLQAGLTSHAAVALVYARHAKALDSLASAAESKQARLRLLASNGAGD